MQTKKNVKRKRANICQKKKEKQRRENYGILKHLKMYKTPT